MESSRNTPWKLRRREGILLILLALGLGLWAFFPKEAGSTVTAEVDGRSIGTYALDRDAEIPIAGHGDFSLTLVIEDGQARVEAATCPDLVCQRHSPISQKGEQIICAPAHTVITVRADEEEEEFDAVAQ